MQYHLAQAKLQVELQSQLTTHRLQQLNRSIREDGNLSLIDYQTKCQLQEKLKRLQQAQNRIQSGTYGVCTGCGQPIDPERMEIVPDTTMCAFCVQRALRVHVRTSTNRNSSFVK